MTTTAAVRVHTLKPLDATGWGVWDNHLQQWLSSGYPHPGDAWRALIQVETSHPWELAVAEAADDGRPVPAGADGAAEKCKTCDGDGECFTCGAECRACDGTGEAA